MNIDKNEGGYIDYVEPFPLGTGLSSKVITSGQPLMLNTLEEEIANGAYFPPEIIEQGSGSFGQSWLGVPVIGNDQVLGIVALADSHPYAFNENHLRLMQTLSSNVGAALENARLFDETQRLLVETQQRTAELEIINRVGMALARQLNNEAIIAMVGEGLSEIFPEQMCSIALYNKATDTISWPYFASFDGQQINQEPVALGPGLTSHVIRSRQPLVLGTLQEAEPYGVVWVYDGAEQEPKSWIGVPILVGDEATGVLAVQDMPENRYNENDVRLLATLAASMGVALENARLYHETQRRADQMALTAEVGREMSATLDLQTVLESTAAHVHELFQARDTILRLADQDGESFPVLVALGKYADQYRNDVVQLGSGITGSIALSGQAEIIDDLSLDERTQHVVGTPEVEEIPETMMCAPLIARERTIGLLSVYRDRPEGLFTPVDLDFLVGLARQAAISIENAAAVHRGAAPEKVL